MGESETSDPLKAIIQQLKPLAKPRLKQVVNAISGASVLPFDSTVDKDLLEQFKRAATSVLADIRANPLVSDRPNEAGNKIEDRVQNALQGQGLIAAKPSSKSGKGKSAGYPDLIVRGADSVTYVECKTYNRKTLNSTFRSFYISPSEEFKAHENARHVLFGIELEGGTNSSGERVFYGKSARLVSLDDMLCDIKLEFQSSNKRMYSEMQAIFEINEDAE